MTLSSYLTYWIIMKQTFGIRLSAQAEKIGTDKTEVGVVAYSIRD